MPSSITQPLYDGEPVTLAGFAMRCARAFMPLAHMREEPLGAPVPEVIEPDPWYAEAERKAAEYLAACEARTDADWDAEAVRQHAEAAAMAEAGNVQALTRRTRYEALLAEVRAWEPPTQEHAHLKEYMTERLTDGIDRDCYAWQPPGPVATGAECREETLRSARNSAESARKSHAEEIERAAWRTAWVRALRASLAGATAAGKDGRQ